ncbi:MAG: BPL-N domain-containing protein [Caldimicrobium sp.]
MRRNMEKSMKSALLLSNSHLWGIWTYKALKKAELDFEPILGEEIDETFSKKYKALFVPGGWSKNKLEGLTERQREILKEFIRSGGIYIGICGGASLAGAEGLQIASVKRISERVPSFSGPCKIEFDKSHPLFQKVKPILYLWFPPELEILSSNIKILACFKEPEEEAYVSDLCLKDHKSHLDFFEGIYGIRLDPQYMKGKPLILEETFGQGRVLLSLVHFDTPNCKNGFRLLKNLVEYFQLSTRSKIFKLVTRKTMLQKKFKKEVEICYNKALNLLNFGIRNFLFHKRYPFFYQWKRGIRGLELLNLLYIFEEIVYVLHNVELGKETLDFLSETCHSAQAMIEKVLLALKYDYLSHRGLKIKNGEVLLEEVFGNNKKSYGGLYKALINLLERVLVRLWREAYR